jgi:hypothetical protein
MTNYPWAFHNPNHGKQAELDPARVRAEIKNLREQHSDSVKASIVTGDIVDQDPLQEPTISEPAAPVKRKTKNVTKR